MNGISGQPPPKIGIVDYGSGNLRSVRKAFECCGAMAALVQESPGFDSADAIVVPGVGSFGDCAANLHSSGLWEPILAWVRAGKPYFGICLGYQLLFESSSESPGTAGFGLLAGTVQRFPDAGLKIPHMGWNSLTISNPADPLFANLGPSPSVYFVHSFHPEPQNPGIVSATCDYGVRFAAAISTENIVATQFHPEKSQGVGLTMLRNYVKSLAKTR